MEITKIEKCDNAQIYLREKQNSQNDDIINKQQLEEEMMAILRKFNIIMAQTIVKRKVMSDSLIQAKFDLYKTNSTLWRIK